LLLRAQLLVLLQQLLLAQEMLALLQVLVRVLLHVACVQRSAWGAH
jgi:hypothetical protein